MSDLLGVEETRRARFGLPVRWQPARAGLADGWAAEAPPGQLVLQPEIVILPRGGAGSDATTA